MSELEQSLERPQTDQDVTITINPEGRIYFHELTPWLVPVAVALCPSSPELHVRELALVRPDVEVQ